MHVSVFKETGLQERSHQSNQLKKTPDFPSLSCPALNSGSLIYFKEGVFLTVKEMNSRTRVLLWVLFPSFLLGSACRDSYRNLVKSSQGNTFMFPFFFFSFP